MRETNCSSNKTARKLLPFQNKMNGCNQTIIGVIKIYMCFHLNKNLVCTPNFDDVTIGECHFFCLVVLCSCCLFGTTLVSPTVRSVPEMDPGVEKDPDVVQLVTSFFISLFFFFGLSHKLSRPTQDSHLMKRIPNQSLHSRTLWRFVILGFFVLLGFFLLTLFLDRRWVRRKEGLKANSKKKGKELRFLATPSVCSSLVCFFFFF